MNNFKQALKELQEEKPGLWANIRAKRAKGEKPAHKNSNAHKDAVKAGKKINKMSEGEDWPQEIPSRHGDIIFKLIKVMPDRAKYALIDAETGKEWEPGGRVFKSIASLMASAEDTIMPQGGRQSTHLGEDKSNAIRWFGNLKYYYQKGLSSPDLRDPADKEEYKKLAKDFFSKL